MEVTPDKWVILELLNNGQTVHKVFASWMGGYLDGDSWKLNSGIKSVTEDEDFYYINGYSGSTYKCDKKGYGIATSYSQHIVENFQSVADRNNATITILDETNWRERIK
jgi:hypothetical protein